jgi:MFS transporter, PPP family, 3-phenylpropionic acid transporter
MNIRLFYAAHYLTVAVVMVFFPPYLRALGLSGRQVSSMLAVAPFLHLGAPVVWGWMADRVGRPERLLRLACAGSFTFLLPLLFVRTMPGMLFAYLGHQMFAVGVVGLADALALERVRREGDDYGRMRLWGSASFALMSGVGGALMALRPPGADPLVPAMLATGVGLALLMSLRLRSGDRPLTRDRPHLSEVRVLLRDRRLLFLLAIAPLHWACIAPYHGFFAILLHDRGLSSAVVGRAFMVGVLAEIVALYLFARLHARVTLPTLLAIAFAATVGRWWLIAQVSSPGWMVALQAVHGLTFGLFWSASVSWLGACVPPKLRATGQTLYTASTFGLGNIAGMLATGVIYDGTKSAESAFLIAAVVELLPLALVITLGRRLDPTRASG